jgi:AcrR family transcriptional regulator
VSAHSVIFGTVIGGDEDIDEAHGRSRRAVALPPDERRAAIVAATLPLLLDKGLAVTTRQIAGAAGVAEGTIFRVFPDKEAVVQATVDAAFDPAPTERALAAIDPDLPFEAQLTEAVGIVQRRLSDIWRLMSTVSARPPTSPPDSPALATLIAAHRDQVRLEPAAAARHLRALTLAVSHPALVGDEPLSAVAIVTLFLDGARARPGVPSQTPWPRPEPHPTAFPEAPC